MRHKDALFLHPVAMRHKDALPFAPCCEWQLSLRWAALVLTAVVVSMSYFQYGWWHVSPRSPLSIVMHTCFSLPAAFQRTWAAHSPYYPAAEYVPPPDGCIINQVNLLQRHGARFPTHSNSERIQKPLHKLLGVRIYANESFAFLRDFQWDLGVADMISLGRKQTFESGVQHYTRYQHLFSSHQLPFVRASGSDRVIKSAVIWENGVALASGDAYHPKTSVILPEVDGANNTLDDGMCRNAHSDKEHPNTWRDVFAPPIAARLNAAAPGADLNIQDVVDLMPLCAFESLFHETTSPFCTIFTFEEFQAYEYYEDLSKYYKTGHGNALGPVQGVGYVNELLARLTGTPVADQTQTNTTLDSSPETFPLNRAFYADFSHDNQMLAIYSALGLFRDGTPPNPRKIDTGRTWRVSRMTPFSGRMITEKLVCEDRGEGKEYVRILVNDAIQPLSLCGAGEDGLCELSAFVESQWYARNNGNGDWEKCFS